MLSHNPTKGPMTRLTTMQKREIIGAFAGGASTRQIAARYGVPLQTVEKILRHASRNQGRTT